MAKVAPNVIIASKNAIITWQRTHYSSMKFMTNAKVSHLDLDIHRLEEAMVVHNLQYTYPSSLKTLLTNVHSLIVSMMENHIYNHNAKPNIVGVGFPQ
jgi:hypothetical protein